MTYAGKVLVMLNVVAAATVALPNHLKAVVVDKEPVGIVVPSVSASFGPYSAKAGLGGDGSTGGLFASADSPHGSASAGLGGSVAGDKPVGGLGASASTGSVSVASGGSAVHPAPPAVHPAPPGGHHKPPTHQGPTPFDGIFNIPISVLQAVNTYLNNRGPVTKPVHPHGRRAHRRPVVYKTVIPEGAEGHGAHEAHEAPAVAVDRVGADHATPAEASSVHGHVGADHAAALPSQGHVVVQKRVNYDDIFNIPISALKSVNQLLNGKK